MNLLERLCALPSGTDVYVVRYQVGSEAWIDVQLYVHGKLTRQMSGPVAIARVCFSDVLGPWEEP